MSATLSALSLLTSLLDARTTSSRLAHIQSIKQLTMQEFDSILYQLINLSALFMQSNLLAEHQTINQSIESICATSAHLSIKCKWLCDAVSFTFKQSNKQAINQSIYQSIDQLSKSVEAAYVNGKYVKASVLQSLIDDNQSVNQSVNLRSNCVIDPKGEIDVKIEPEIDCTIEPNNQASLPDSLSPDVDADVMFALSKKQRLDYFDSINQLIYQFNEAGQTLINQPISERQTVVKRLVQSINQSAKRLYIPAQPAVLIKERNRWASNHSVNQSTNQTPSSSTRGSMLRTAPLATSHSFDSNMDQSITLNNIDTAYHESSNQSVNQSTIQAINQSVLPIACHYTIDRLIASQSVALSSKQRAPFLVCAEVHYTGRDVYDPLIYQSIDQTINQLNNQLINQLDASANQTIKRTATEPHAASTPHSPSPTVRRTTKQSKNQLLKQSTVPILVQPDSLRPRSKSEVSNDQSNQPTPKSVARPSIKIPRQPSNQSLNQTQPSSRSRPPRHTTAPSSPSPLKQPIIQSNIPPKPTRRQSNLDQVSPPVKRSSKQSTVDYLRSLPFSVLDAAFGPNWAQRKQHVRDRSKYARSAHQTTNQPSTDLSVNPSPDNQPNGQSLNQSTHQETSQLNNQSHENEWDLISFLIKGQDPAIAQELLASQLINVCRSIFDQSINQSHSQSIYLMNLSINLSGPDSAIVEAIVDASSVDSIKRKMNIQSINDFFVAYFTHPHHPANLSTNQSADRFDRQSVIQSIYAAALNNYFASIVGYSLITYVFAVRDRHNGNLMLDRSGHVLHIDFGFLLGNSPGRNMNFENCPFKMTEEYWSLISEDGSMESQGAKRFVHLFEMGFMALRARWIELIALIRPLANARLPCFEVNTVAEAISGIKSRLCVDLSEADARARARACVAESVGHWRSQQYDLLQYYANSIR